MENKTQLIQKDQNDKLDFSFNLIKSKLMIKINKKIKYIAFGKRNYDQEKIKFQLIIK